jgi:hypothetical protein
MRAMLVKYNYILRLFCVPIVSTALFSYMSLPALGKDLNVLIRVLYPAFFIEQGAAMCSVPNVQLSDDDRLLFMNTKNYAQWIKQKATANLPPDEVLSILRSSADRAKDELSEVIKVLKSYPANREYAELSVWCTTKMNSFARKIVLGYVEERKKIDDLIEDAKRN